jgi:hypothetical protein
VKGGTHETRDIESHLERRTAVKTRFEEYRKRRRQQTNSCLHLLVFLQTSCNDQAMMTKMKSYTRQTSFIKKIVVWIMFNKEDCEPLVGKKE